MEQKEQDAERLQIQEIIVRSKFNTLSTVLADFFSIFGILLSFSDGMYALIDFTQEKFSSFEDFLDSFLESSNTLRIIGIFRNLFEKDLGFSQGAKKIWGIVPNMQNVSQLKELNSDEKK